jgi:hypothetical protein
LFTEDCTAKILEINDETDDFDYPEDYDRYLKRHQRDF